MEGSYRAGPSGSRRQRRRLIISSLRIHASRRDGRSHGVAICARRLHLALITATLGPMSASPGWPPRPRIVALSAALLALTLRTATFADVACEDIAKVDLANSVLPIPGEGARAFSNGVACWDYDGGPGCEWRSEIHLDLLTTPESGTSLRVLKIFESHMRGSGSWARMIGYRCERGRLVATFSERFECGADVIKAFGPSLLVSVSEGWPNYTHGCQDRSAAKLFTWCAPEHTYRLDPISGGTDDPPRAPPAAAVVVPGNGNLPP
jgi:hypothetical protein